MIWREARGQASERHLVPCCPGCVYIGRSLEMFFSPVIDITSYQRMRQYLYLCTRKSTNADEFVLQMLNFAPDTAAKAGRSWRR